MPDPRETEDHVPMAEAAEPAAPSTGPRPASETPPATLPHTPAPETGTGAADPSRGFADLSDPVPLAAAADDESDPAAFGQYRIVRKLGEGGMGAVYLAEQRSPRRPVALKVIRPDRVSPRLLLRFRMESQILAWVRHPAVAQVYESGEAVGPHGRQPFYAMEYVEGEPLDKFAEASDLDDRGRVELVAAVCDGVEAAHRRGITHRDLKPANVMVTAEGQPKILDFGVARVSDADAAPHADQTAQGQVIGTLNYMSPEQAAGDPAGIDTRADVYALGVILYELLAGRLPIDLRGKSLTAAVYEIMSAVPPSLASIDRRFRGDLSAIAAKALAKDPKERYQSAADLAEDLRRFLNDLPVQASPPGAWVALRKFVRRNKLVTMAFGVTLLAIILGSGAAISYGLEAKAEVENRRKADIEKDKAREQERLANAERDKAIAPRTFTMGRLQQRQGRYKEALDSFDLARKLGYDDEIEYMLASMECQTSLAHSKEARELATQLAARKDLGRHEAEVLLRLGEAGYTTSQKFGGDPDEQIRRALASGKLPPARAAYARGISSTNFPDIERELAESIRLDPANPDAAVLLIICQLLLGKLDDARETAARLETLEPGTLGARVFAAVIAFLERDQAALDRAVKRLAELSPAQAEMMAALGKSVLPILNDDLAWNLTPQNLPKLIAPLMATVPKALAASGEAGSDLGAMQKAINLPILRGIQKLNLMQMVAQAAAGGGPTETLFDTVPDVCPSGFTYFCRGMERMHGGKLVKAIEDFQRALELPSPVPIRKAVLARLAQALIITFNAPLTDNERRLRKEELRVVIRELARMAPVPSDEETEHLVVMGTVIGELPAAAMLAADLLAKKPDDPRSLRLRAVLAFEYGAHQNAVQAADQALKADPKDVIARAYRDRAAQKLQDVGVVPVELPKNPAIPQAIP